MKKRIFSAVLAAIVFFCMMPMQVRADPAYIITNSTPEASKTLNNGYITIDETSATSGTTVTVTVIPSEGYELESLTATPAAPTISTIADVLNTIEVFPASDDQNTPAGNAWVADVQDNKQFYAYTYTHPVYGTTVLLLKDPEGAYAYFSITREVTEGENCYTVSDVYESGARTRILTFNMVNGILTSLMCEGSAGYDGTYVPASTPSARLQPITPVKQTDGTYQFTMPACDVSAKAKFKPTTPAPDPEPWENYLEPLEEMINEAIESGDTSTIYWDKGDALPNYIMHLLFENPALSLDFKYTYEGVEYEIYIGPGQAVNEDIGWFGPLWLHDKYCKKKAIPPIHGVYIIQKGDTLYQLARKFNTSVDALLRLNPNIKDMNLIYPGNTLNY